MRIIDWKNRVRVGVGELSRAQSLEVYKQIDNIVGMHRDDTEYPLIAACVEVLAARSVRSVSVFQNDEWIGVTHEKPKAYDAADAAALSCPMSAETLANLPVSLYTEIIEAARVENELVYNQLFLASNSIESSTETTSEPPSDSPSS